MIYSKFDVKTGMYKLYERSEGRPDVECTYTDDKGAEITLTKKDTYRCAPGRTVKRDSDGKFVNVFAGDECVIGNAKKQPSEPPTLTHVIVSTLPTKTTYTVGDKLDLTGIIVKAKYSDDSEKEVTNYTTTPADKSTLDTAGQTEIVVSLEDKSATFKVTVNEA